MPHIRCCFAGLAMATFNFLLAKIFNCAIRFAYELWPDETNKLIKRFRAKVFACYLFVGIVPLLPLFAAPPLVQSLNAAFNYTDLYAFHFRPETCLVLHAFAAGVHSRPLSFIYVNLLFININYVGQCACGNCRRRHLTGPLSSNFIRLSGWLC